MPSGPRGYVVAVAAVGVAAALTLALQPYIGTAISPLFFAAVVVACWSGGLRPGLLATVLWILAVVVGLLAVILCVTIILLPLGIPLLLLSRKLFGAGGRLVVPRSVRHPIQEADKAADKSGDKARKRARKLGKSMPDLDADKAKKKTRKFLKRQRKTLAG